MENKIISLELEAFQKTAIAEYANFHRRDKGFTRLGVDAFGKFIVTHNGTKHIFNTSQEAISFYYECQTS